MSSTISFFHTHVSPEALAEARAALESTFISEGARVKAFEGQLAQMLGIRGPVAVNSGTTALHLALVLAGVSAGDEVILPAQTFVATGLVVLMQGATAVFADIDPTTGNLDPRSVAAKITPRTRAIMPVHWAGLPCDMDEIHTIAERQGLAVVEDAAHALGATYHGRPVGALSRFTAFSFQAIKHVTTGDGGALACVDPADEKAARTRRWFGIDREAAAPSILGERVYDIAAVGYKYHMNDLAAAVGLGNLAGFPSRLARRRAIARRYRQGLERVPGVTLLREPPDREHAYWLFTLLVDRREDFIRKLQSRGIPASVVHLRIDRNTCFGGLRDDLPGQAFFDERQVAIPVHEALSDEQVSLILETIQSGW